MGKILYPEYRVSYEPGKVLLWTWKPELFAFVLAFTLTWTPAPKTVEIRYEQTLRVKSKVDFVGTPFDGYVYVAIGARTALGFDEILYKDVAISLPDTPAWKTYDLPDVDIKITREIAPGTYHLYAKIMDADRVDKAFSPYYENAVEVLPVAEFKELTIVDYVVI